MGRTRSYPVSAKGVAIAVKLIVAYVVLVANAILFYLLITGEGKPPLNYLLLIAAAGVSAWALHKRWQWGLWLVVSFFGWQLYVGTSGAAVYFNAANRNTSAEAVTFLALWIARTILIVVIFATLTFYTLRNETDS